LSYIKAAAEAIAPVLEKGNLVILESTSPVGATEKMCQWMADKRPDLSFPHNNTNNSDIAVAHCPERVLPGHVVRELVENDRIIGGITPSCAEKAQALYDIFVQGTCYITDAKTAEMAKLVENSYRDVNIAFANELSIICNKLNINVWDLITLANKHPRVNILQPGCGVGGHCIAVDPWFIIDSAPKEAKLIKQARLVNESKPEFVVSQVLEHANKFKKPTVACLGLAFKPDIDDLRESPALKIMNKLASIDSIEVLAVEPNINETAKGLAENASLVSMEEAVKRADIIVILVKHKQFKNLEGHLDQKIFLDFVNI
jgi:UDP-N-acetyl-D-mannosaminuronic acid dehydrogenase